MKKLFVVSHTHWDREWYAPFQVYRMRLVHCIDQLLELFEVDPDYAHFLLDGQTIVLEDYLEVRPERAEILRTLVQKGKLDVGPWYVLPDEFLVSGEAIVRNLMRGIELGNRFGGAMKLGYIPDPFGHISQMPQILLGFGISTTLFRRGLADEPCELWWEGSDGSRLLACYLRDGYDNAAWLPRTGQTFSAGLAALAESLSPHSRTFILLALNGTDHMEPWADLSRLISAARESLTDFEIIRGSLADYATSVQEEIESRQITLDIVHGELRNPKRHHLLPGVASSRTWIKQLNANAQMLLEKWAEPLTAFTQGNASLVRLAWKYLLQNHPHDSICGCGVDETHADMKPRFAWVEQIAYSIIEEGLVSLASTVDTRHCGGNVALIVMNPNGHATSNLGRETIALPTDFGSFELLDDLGQEIPYSILDRRVQDYSRGVVSAKSLLSVLEAWNRGGVSGLSIQAICFAPDKNPGLIDITIGVRMGTLSEVEQTLRDVQRYVEKHSNDTFQVYAHSPELLTLEFVARNVPGIGYRTYAVRHCESSSAVQITHPGIVENEFIHLEADPVDGTLTLIDKSTGVSYQGINRLTDGGDRGDLYNYCPPEKDTLVVAPASSPVISTDCTPVRQSMRVAMRYALPASLSPDRSARSTELVEQSIETTVSLYPGVRRVDLTTVVENLANDHRLRVEFPTPILTDHVSAGQPFDILDRSIRVPSRSETDGWVEQPRPEAPMQGFVSITNGRAGITLATRGLPEYEARHDEHGVTLVLTLVRCVGWLSRGDLANRQGNAGPTLQTPGAQEIGKHVFEYALIPHGGDWRNAMAEAHAFGAPLRATTTGVHLGTLPAIASLVHVSIPGFLISSIKTPERGSGILVRGYNPLPEPINVQIRLWRRFARAVKTSLDEEYQSTLELFDGTQVEFPVRAKEIVTVRFE